MWLARRISRETKQIILRYNAQDIALFNAVKHKFRRNCIESGMAARGTTAEDKLVDV